ncbi:MAG: TIGR01906 family membrane protein [Firmicutes bacterium]|nr:TIGR01906 family membrane protein [Bacillota bacterium]
MTATKKKWHTVLTSISCLFVIVGLMLMTTDFVVQSRAFYNWQFNKNDTAFELGLSEEQLREVRDQLRDYFAGRSDTLQIYVIFDGDTEPTPFYTEDELCHMRDVKEVFLGFRITAWSLLMVGLLTLIILGIFLRRRFVRALTSGAIIGGITFLTIIISMALLILATWERSFEIFHYIFFPQGNWQFSNSNMIDMLPYTLFMDAALIIAGVGIGVAVIFVVAGIVSKIFLKKSEYNS